MTIKNSTLSILEIADLHKRVTDCSRDFHELISEIAKKTEYQYLDRELKDMGFNSETYDRNIVKQIIVCDIVSQFLEERKLGKS